MVQGSAATDSGVASLSHGCGGRQDLVHVVREQGQRAISGGYACDRCCKTVLWDEFVHSCQRRADKTWSLMHPLPHTLSPTFLPGCGRGGTQGRGHGQGGGQRRGPDVSAVSPDGGQVIVVLLLLLVPTAPVMTFVHIERDSEFLRGIPSENFPPHPEGTVDSAQRAFTQAITLGRRQWTSLHFKRLLVPCC